MLPALIAAALSAVTVVQEPGADLLEPVELRALVVDLDELDVLGDRERIAVAMDRIAEVGFDAVIPVAWKEGRALVDSPALAALAPDRPFAARDVLAELTFEAHRAGLEVLPAIDGALTGLAPRPASPAELRALARGFAFDVARAAEIDGLVLLDGLPPLTREEALGSEGKAAAQELVAWRGALKEFDPSLVLAWVARDARLADPGDLGVLDAVDFVLLPAPRAGGDSRLDAWLGAGSRRAGLWLARLRDEAPDALLASLARAREAPFAGEALGPFAALARADGALFDALSQGVEAPYYARATLPWRGTVAWRPPAEVIGPQIDAGGWTDSEDSQGYTAMTLPAGEAGSLSWSWKRSEAGVHELWIHLPVEGELAPRLEFLVPTDPRRPRKVAVDTTQPAGRGWVSLGRALLNEPRRVEVLRLDVPPDGAAPAHVGPLVALIRRRAEGR